MDSGDIKTFEASTPDGLSTLETVHKPLPIADDDSFVEETLEPAFEVVDLCSNDVDVPNADRFCSRNSLIATCNIQRHESSIEVDLLWSDAAHTVTGDLNSPYSEWWAGVGETESSRSEVEVHPDEEAPSNMDSDLSASDYNPVGAIVLWDTGDIDVSEVNPKYFTFLLDRCGPIPPTESRISSWGRYFPNR